MKTETKKQALTFLRECKAHMDKKDVIDFCELGQSGRVLICALFEDYFADYIETDGDCDGYTMTATLDDNTDITIYSHAREFDDIAEDSCAMSLSNIRGETEDIDVMIYALEQTPADDEVIALLNTTIVTSDGAYECETISLDTAKSIIKGAVLDSAVGHEGTAQIMTQLLGVDVPVNRQHFVQQPGQRAVVLKLRGRPQEGVVLSREQIEEIGYDFKLLTRTA